MDPVGTLVTGIAAYGLAGLIAVSFAERLIPIIPSHALLVAIGAAAADGAWPLWAATGATAFGSTLGCASGFLAFRTLGNGHTQSIARSVGRSLALPEDRIDAWIASAGRNSGNLAFTLQLVPTARFLAPALAVLVGMRQRGFLMASAFGIVIWNSAFIAIGYTASDMTEAANATILALGMAVCLPLAQFGILVVLRRMRVRRRLPALADR